VDGILRNIWTGLTTASLLDQVNLVLGIAGVWLMVRRSLWAFPVGLAAVTVQGVLFVQMKFPADATLQAFYFVALAWGWWHWTRARGAGSSKEQGPSSRTAAAAGQGELPVTMLSWRGRTLTLAAAAAATVIWALGPERWTGAVMPWRDASTAWFMVAAQVLQSRKNIENWPLWIAANAIAIPAYWNADHANTAFLYLIYLGMAVAGWRQWRRAMKEQKVA
jgi:nicotinamide mononucleotide transporter